MVASQITRKTFESKENLRLVSVRAGANASVAMNATSAAGTGTSVYAPASGISKTIAPFDFLKIEESLKKSAYKVIVVKIGGYAVDNSQVLDGLLGDVMAMYKAGIHVIIVHGGGSAVNNALSAIGKKTEKIGGLRVTDSETLDVALKVFTQINELIVQKLQQKGACALGFCAQSAIPFETKKMILPDNVSGQTDESKKDLGWVGEITNVNCNALENWMRSGWIPVVSPIGVDQNGQYYNINADHAALALACGVESDGLIFMTDVPGLLADVSDPTSRISHVTPLKIQNLISEGTVGGGMLPKIKSCIKAVDSGISSIAILNSFEPNALLNGFVAPQDIGTLITGEKNDN